MCLLLGSLSLYAQQGANHLTDSDLNIGVPYNKLLSIRVDPFGGSLGLEYETKGKKNRFTFASLRTRYSSRYTKLDSTLCGPDTPLEVALSNLVGDGSELNQIGLSIGHRKYLTFQNKAFLIYYDLGLNYWLYNNENEDPFKLRAANLGTNVELGLKWAFRKKFVIGTDINLVNYLEENSIPSLPAKEILLELQLGYRLGAN